VGEQVPFDETPPTFQEFAQRFASEHGLAAPHPRDSVAQIDIVRVSWWERVSPLARMRRRRQLREQAAEFAERANAERRTAARLREQAAQSDAPDRLLHWAALYDQKAAFFDGVAEVPEAALALRPRPGSARHICRSARGTDRGKLYARAVVRSHPQSARGCIDLVARCVGTPATRASRIRPVPRYRCRYRALAGLRRRSRPRVCGFT
jgi:hypothetical protein